MSDSASSVDRSDSPGSVEATSGTHLLMLMQEGSMADSIPDFTSERLKHLNSVFEEWLTSERIKEADDQFGWGLRDHLREMAVVRVAILEELSGRPENAAEHETYRCQARELRDQFGLPFTKPVSV